MHSETCNRGPTLPTRGAGLRAMVAVGAACWLAAALHFHRLTAEETEKGTALNYPHTRAEDCVDDYHGTRVADPYRWLEDPDSEETRDWVRRENALTFSFLNAIPQRKPIRERLSAVWNYQRFGIPTRRGDRYFYSRNDGLQNQAVLYWAASLDAEPVELLDPNRLSNDGTVALSSYEISDDGRLLAYGLATAGSDWQEWRIRDVSSGKDLDDHLRWVKFSGAAWTPDHRGFFYSRFDEPEPGQEFTGTNYYQKLYYHRVGTAQSDDDLVYKRDDEKEWGFGGEVTDDGRFLMISVSLGTLRKNQLFYRDLTQPNASIIELIRGFDWQYQVVGSQGTVLYVRTDDGAPRNRVVAIDTEHPDRKNWREIIRETDNTLENTALVGGRLFATYLQDAHSLVQVYSLAGVLEREIELPGLGTVAGFTGKQQDEETSYSFNNYHTPPTIYRYDIATAQSQIFRQPRVDFAPGDYETKQVFYTSADGTRIPMFISHRRGLSLDGHNPTLLYGYGGFNIPLTPSFSPATLVWMEMGGVYAVPNLRGGGEYGRQWHEAGMLDKKQNVFDDFIAAAKWLIDSGYTTPAKLAISGGSNGGLLVGACITQRPELFGAAVPAVGVLDMLRYHKFTIGWAWVNEYGSADDPLAFQTLIAYSPLHRIKPGTKYPAVLIKTADHDDRVVPAHSFKFAAALQQAQGGDAPVLIRIETSAGHGAGKPTAKLIDDVADTWAFLMHVLDATPKP